MSQTTPPRRRRRLPRLLTALVLGGAATALVYAYVGAPAASSVALPAPTVPPRAQVLVAARDLEAQTILQPDMLQVRSLPQEAVLPKALTDTESARGRALLVPVAAGEQILSTKLADPKATTEATSEPNRLADKVPPGM